MYGYGTLPRNDDILYIRSLQNAKLYDNIISRYSLVKDPRGEYQIIESKWDRNPIDLVTIMKDRSGMFDYEISKELGFNVKTPDTIGKNYRIKWKTVLDTSQGESISKYYENAADIKDWFKIIIYKINAASSDIYKIDDELIAEKTEIEILRKKVIMYSFYGLDNYIKFNDILPNIIRLDSYIWTDADSVLKMDFYYNGSKIREAHEKIIYEIIRSRK